MKRIIAITGMPGSGKSTATDILKKEGFKFAGMGDAVRKEMLEKGIGINNVSLRRYALKIGKISKYYVLNLVKKDIDNIFKEKDVVILDGVRRLAEIEKLKKDGYNTISIGIIADKQLRYERMLKRGNSSDMKNFEEFEWREEQELKFGIAEVISTADYYLINNSGLDEFTSNLHALFDKISVKA